MDEKNGWEMRRENGSRENKKRSACRPLIAISTASI
jgi:hypothetical protein